ncbi:hypothetical protein PsYK624_139670 [Phanerochaete sordida]|uniref:Smr domain-containing protein n=1 Tax=Phanerochaete sordida TaxID=48140 RepID=A0A9P3GMI5_9APHY|nr:hypothetical protein PsYK624_139670 [Phanerochaete sordida]
MENIAAIGAGLGLRVLIDTVAGRTYTASVLIGLWEGIVLNHFLAKFPSSAEPILALGFRLFVDFLFTESLARLMIILLWTGLGMLLADVSVQLSADYRFRRLWRKTQQNLPVPLSNRSRSLPQRVRFYDNPEASGSGSGSATLSVASPGVPVRPTTTPVPGRYDQWSEATRSTGTDQSRTVSDAASATLETSEHARDFIAEFGQERSRTPSELEYVTLPAIPDAPDTPGPVPPAGRYPSRPLTGASYPTIPDDIADLPVELDRRSVGGSGLTTPPSQRSALAGLPEEDRPRVHSGLTSPEPVRSPLSVQTSGLPPTVSVPPPPEKVAEAQPMRLTLADPSPTSMPPPVAMPEPVAVSVSQLPNIPTPDDNVPNRNSDPPPTFEEAIKSPPIPDDLSVMDQDSVISGADKQAVIARADDMRKKAREQEKERDRIRQAWRKAEREGRFFDALRLEIELEDAQAQVDSLHAKAARRYFHAHNLERSSHEVDVHRLTSAEAITHVRKGLRQALIQESPELRVIVGKGLHSKNNQPVLKKAIMDELKNKYRITATEDPKNAGVLIIKMPPPPS